MTILADRWRGLRRLPHVSLASLPTPIELVEPLSKNVGAEVWIKRDDVSGVLYGGNKVRKLEYVLGDALSRDADVVVVAGAAGSHHVLATAVYAAELGLGVRAVLSPQRYTPHADATLRASQAAGATIHPVRGVVGTFPAMTSLAARLRLRGHRPVVVPIGGTSLNGMLGYVEAGIEISRQLESRAAPEPQAIFLPLGSGGTLAGLAVGLAAAGITSRVVGVRVVPRAFGNAARIRRLITRLVEWLRGLDPRFPDVAVDAKRQIEIDHREYGDGYGEPTGAARAASRALHPSGIELDPTYTSKAFAALLRRARSDLRGRRLLFLHTLSANAPAVGGAEALPLPSPLRRLMIHL